MPTSVPRGSTQKGVNQAVFDLLAEALDASTAQTLIDVPCGHGDFAQFLSKTFPRLKVIGVDAFEDGSNKGFEFHRQTAHEFLGHASVGPVDAVTCISGIMCFDGAEGLFAKFAEALKPGGTVVVTNDNIMTVRDRFNFLFFGHFKRFPLLYKVREGNWNVVLPQGVVMLLRRAGFQDIKVRYTSIYFEDWFLAPFALLLFPLFFLNLALRRSDMSLRERLRLFPPQALLARHYVISARISVKGLG